MNFATPPIGTSSGGPGHRVFTELVNTLRSAPLVAPFAPPLLLRRPAPLFLPQRRKTSAEA